MDIDLSWVNQSKELERRIMASKAEFPWSSTPVFISVLFAPEQNQAAIGSSGPFLWGPFDRDEATQVICALGRNQNVRQVRIVPTPTKK